MSQNCKRKSENQMEVDDPSKKTNLDQIERDNFVVESGSIIMECPLSAATA